MSDCFQIVKVGDYVVPTIGRYAGQRCKIVSMEQMGSASGWFTVETDDGSSLLFTGDELIKSGVRGDVA